MDLNYFSARLLNIIIITEKILSLLKFSEFKDTPTQDFHQFSFPGFLFSFSLFYSSLLSNH